MLKCEVGQSGRSQVVEVIYHMDATTLHEARPNVMVTDSPAPPPPGRHEDAPPPAVSALALQQPSSHDISAGVVLQRLWCKYATEFIESIILASDDTVVLSMGPSLSRSCDSIFTSVDALTGPSVDVRDDFFNRDKPLALDFQPEPPADVVCAVPEMSVAQSSTSNMAFCYD